MKDETAVEPAPPPAEAPPAEPAPDPAPAPPPPAPAPEPPPPDPAAEFDPAPPQPSRPRHRRPSDNRRRAASPPRAAAQRAAPPAAAASSRPSGGERFRLLHTGEVLGLASRAPGPKRRHSDFEDSQGGRDHGRRCTPLGAAPALAKDHDHGKLRFATFNASVNRNADGQLVQELSNGDDPQLRNVAEIIQRARPDVLLINEFDFVPDQQAARLFQRNYLSVPQNGARAIRSATASSRRRTPASRPGRTSTTTARS